MNSENEKGVEMIKAAQSEWGLNRPADSETNYWENRPCQGDAARRPQRYVLLLPCPHSFFPPSLLPFLPLGTRRTSIRQSQHVEDSHGLSISLIHDGIRARSMKQY